MTVSPTDGLAREDTDPVQFRVSTDPVSGFRDGRPAGGPGSPFRRRQDWAYWDQTPLSVLAVLNSV